MELEILSSSILFDCLSFTFFFGISSPRQTPDPSPQSVPGPRSGIPARKTSALQERRGSCTQFRSEAGRLGLAMRFPIPITSGR